ncbi:MAG: 3'(2'),5'-bisphosphate nucleotidase CysQ [Pseudomonadota bacterium]|nr:3'(2'),5'-bisphosphate nucleotidase CysQ [Pseudomonadota bacterium]
MTDDSLLDEMIALALEAGAATMGVYAGKFDVSVKADASPVTQADEIAEAIILKGLAGAAPDIPVLAEESAAAGRIPTLGRRFFLVDPLDGTKEFVSKTGEFTVNIALIEDGAPTMGVVYAPAMGRLYAASKTAGAFRVDGDGPRKPISARKPPAAGLVAVASRSHRNAETDEFLSKLTITDFAAAGSSLKFCLVAEGAADVYPRLGRTMEWDTGAGQAVLEAAGGRVLVHPAGDPLAYGKKARGFDNPHFIAWGA